MENESMVNLEEKLDVKFGRVTKVLIKHDAKKAARMKVKEAKKQAKQAAKEAKAAALAAMTPEEKASMKKSKWIKGVAIGTGVVAGVGTVAYAVLNHMSGNKADAEDQVDETQINEYEETSNGSVEDYPVE